MPCSWLNPSAYQVPGRNEAWVGECLCLVVGQANLWLLHSLLKLRASTSSHSCLQLILT